MAKSRFLDRSTRTWQLPLYPSIGTVDTNVRERMMGSLLMARVGYQKDMMLSDSIQDLASDVFYSMYKAEPAMVEDVASSRYLNNALMNLLRRSPNYETIRSSTVANITTSLQSTSLITSALMSDDAVRDALLQQQQLEQLQEQLSKMQNQLAQSQGGESGGGQGQQQDDETEQDSTGGSQDQDENKDKDKQPELSDYQKQKQYDKRQKEKNIQNQIDKKEKQIQGQQKKLQKRVDKIADSPLAGGMMSSAVGDGEDGVDEVNAMMSTWGVDPGEVSYDDANMLVEMAISKEGSLALVAELGGRVADVSASTLQAVRDSYVGAPSEPTYTRDFLRMFPMERAYMSQDAPPIVRTLKVSQWAQRGVLGLRPKSEGKKRGALVIAVDGSSSMSSGLCQMRTGDGNLRQLDRGEVAKVLSVGVARAMREDRFEKRRYSMFSFAASEEQLDKTESSDEWRETLEWIKIRPRGGTDFDMAFRFAIDELERFEIEGTLGADLLFISDGEANLSNSVKRRLKEYRDRTGARVFYIQVSDERHTRGWSLKGINLDGVVDAFVVVSDDASIDDLPGYLAEQVSSVFAQVD